MNKNEENILKRIEAKFKKLFGDDDADDDLEGIFEPNDIDDMLDNTIILNDENGGEAEFEFLDLIEYEGEEYIILLPKEDDADEVVILKVEDTSGDEESYISVEDEDTLQTVFEIFKEKFKDEFNFVD